MLIIGIAGGSGSGKTTVVKRLKRTFKDRIVVIPQDSYYKDSGHLTEEEKKVYNFDHPNAIDFDLLCAQLEQIKSGQAIEQPVYSYITCERSKTETVHVEPADIILVEGILIFTCQKLMKQMDIKVFVDADDDDRLSRIMQRDIEERGKDVAAVIKRYNDLVEKLQAAQKAYDFTNNKLITGRQSVVQKGQELIALGAKENANRKIPMPELGLE